MRPLQPHNSASDMHQAFAQAADSWLLRARNPHADTAVLDGVQRRQEHQDDAVRTAGPSGDASAAAAPAAARTARLVRIEGQQQSDTWLLPHNRPVLIGRSGKRTSPVDVDLWPDTGVSRRHALLWFDGEGWCIEDLRSKNGTLLGEHNIRGQRGVRLTPGTRLQLGRTTLMLVTLAAVDEPSAAPEAAAVPSQRMLVSPAG